MLNNLFKNNKKTQKRREKSTGRSMVEMLGVLAIIGVLSIGGITGYTIAMRRYRANEILNVANKYALIIYSVAKNKMMNGDGVVSEYGEWIDKNDTALDDVPSFTATGLGGLPNGLKEIKLLKFVTNQSGDLVVLLLDLEDNPLCQTVFQLSGTELNEGSTWGYCDNDGTSVFVTFIMN